MGSTCVGGRRHRSGMTNNCGRSPRIARASRALLRSRRPGRGHARRDQRRRRRRRGTNGVSRRSERDDRSRRCPGSVGVAANKNGSGEDSRVPKDACAPLVIRSRGKISPSPDFFPFQREEQGNFCIDLMSGTTQNQKMDPSPRLPAVLLLPNPFPDPLSSAEVVDIECCNCPSAPAIRSGMLRNKNSINLSVGTSKTISVGHSFR